jgi:hypothetical protein
MRVGQRRVELDVRIAQLERVRPASGSMGVVVIGLAIGTKPRYNSLSAAPPEPQ